MTLLALMVAVHIGQAAPAGAPPIDFGAVADKSLKAIRNGFYDRTRRKDELDRIIAKHEPAIRAAKTKDEFGDRMNEMIEEFGDSHFGFLPDTQQGYYSFGSIFPGSNIPEMPHIGAWFRKEKNQYRVQMVLNGMPAEKAGVRPGDVMVSFDGVPFSPIEALRPKMGSQGKLVWRRGNQEMSADVDVEHHKGMDMFLEATRRSIRIIEYKGKKLGYIHLWTMANDRFKDLLSNAVYGKLAHTDGFILDIRDGFGGRPEGFGDPFFRPSATFEWKTPQGSQEQMFGYGKPLAVLINGGSRSAKEVFSYVIKKSGRGKLIGTRTAGNVLGTSPLKVADWAYLEIPYVDMLVDGQRLEKNGVKPDIEVADGFGPKGEDLVLEKALGVLAK